MSLFHRNAPLGGPFQPEPESLHTKRLGAIQQITLAPRRLKDSDLIDYAIVGVGAAGGVLLQRLARAGFKVIGFEAGPFWDTEHQWVSDEAGSHNLYWNDLRITGGKDPLALGSNNSGKGVGGGSVHWASFVPRFHPSDFEVYTQDGVAADWPIRYEDLEPTTNCSKERCPLPVLPTIHGANRMVIPTVHTQWVRSVMYSSKAARPLAFPSRLGDRWQSSPHPTVIARTASTAASAFKVARSVQKLQPS